jgi:hypothetical protein
MPAARGHQHLWRGGIPATFEWHSAGLSPSAHASRTHRTGLVRRRIAVPGSRRRSVGPRAGPEETDVPVGSISAARQSPTGFWASSWQAGSAALQQLVAACGRQFNQRLQEPPEQFMLPQGVLVQPFVHLQHVPRSPEMHQPVDAVGLSEIVARVRDQSCGLETVFLTVRSSLVKRARIVSMLFSFLFMGRSLQNPWTESPPREERECVAS